MELATSDAFRYKNNYQDRRPPIAKYKQALKSLKPYRFTKKNKSPLDNAGFFSMSTLSWLSDVIYKARKEITIEDLPALSQFDTIRSTGTRLFRLYQEDKKKHPNAPSTRRALFKSITTRFLLAFVASTLSFVLGLIGPAVVVNQLVLFTSTSNPSIGYGIGLCFALLGADLLRTLTHTLSWVINVRTMIRGRSAISSLLFEKLVKLKSLKEKSAGEMINLLVNDLQRVADMLIFFTFLCSAPIGIVGGTIYSCSVLGWTALMGLVGCILLIPVQAIIVRLGFKYRSKAIVFTDQRVRTINEIINCIKLIKLYAWETSFAKIISEVRGKERRFIVKTGALHTILGGIIPIAPTILAVFTLLVHTGIGYPLTAAQAFTTIAIFHSMRASLGILPLALKAFTEALVSFKRFDQFLIMEEVDDYAVKIQNCENAIELRDLTAASLGKKLQQDEKQNGLKDDVQNENGTSDTQNLEASVTKCSSFSGEITLVKDLSLNVKKGSLLGICGSVGSGKSSFISAILGELRIQEGSVGIDGKLAYVPQQAWLFHGTVRKNILFGSTFDEKKYKRVIEACSLNQDIAIFPNKDFTEIGERGITLSGGQKQRISLARAVYSERDIVLLDDPLSAVDAHVGKHIFYECIKKVLTGKTVVFVTHQLHYLKDCDDVIMLKDGRVAEHGDHESLMNESGEYADLLKRFVLKGENEEKKEANAGGENTFKTRSLVSGTKEQLPEEEHSAFQNSETDEEKPEPLMLQEENQYGTVRWKTYKAYIIALGGYIVSFLLFLHAFLYLFGITVTNFWLTYWINEGGQVLCPNETNTGSFNSSNCTTDSNIVTNPKTGFYQIIYGCILFLSFVILLLRALIYPNLSIRASSKLHNKLFETILRCPMSFFDRTPVGRLLNRFTRDIDEIDNRLPLVQNHFFATASVILLSLASISFAFPYFLIVCLVLAIVFIIFFQVYRSGVREFKRFENVYRSPYISHVKATTHGLSSIHAYQKSNDFNKLFESLIDAHAVPYQSYYYALQWMSLRLDTLAIAINFIVALFVVISSIYPQSFGVTEGSAFAGLALTHAVQMTGLFQACIRFMIETESLYTSVERVRDYVINCPAERPNVIEDKRPSSGWPDRGEIRFQNVKMRYRPELPEVLHDVTIQVKPKEKIGIVGRTGSGKSSLGAVLFRLVELSHGQIFIDDVDIAEIGLEDLRKKLTIIPQDPVLFVGSVRYNLDPFQQYSDDEIWKALERCHIKKLVSDLPDKLENKVIENGENFSVGERQLLCMARAILRHTKIIMLDEATAAIDSETDSLVQDTIREAFADCTMLTIAHRLNTILSSDKILVMENGRVAEFVETYLLLNNPNSLFSKMLAVSASTEEGGLSGIYRSCVEETTESQDEVTSSKAAKHNESQNNSVGRDENVLYSNPTFYSS